MRLLTLEDVVAWKMSRHFGPLADWLRLRSPLVVLMIHSFGSDAQAVSVIQIKDWLTLPKKTRILCLSWLLLCLIPAPPRIYEPARVGTNAPKQESRTRGPGCSAWYTDLSS
ncbi:hypothetical protein BJX70DRAFT_63987 [Aspergillus crustosus]